MKKIVWMGIGTVLFVSFQNCAPSLKSSVQSDSATDKVETQFNKISASEFPIVSLWDSGCDESCSYAELQQAQPQNIEISVESGLVETIPFQPNLAHSKYCLAPQKLEFLKNILAGAEVCEPIIPDHYYDGRACSMIYANPYASLKIDNEDQVPLGERTSGCDIPVDLCGDKAAQLKQFRNSVVSHLDDPSVAVFPNTQGQCPP